MHFDWWTVALQTVNFAILVWLLHRFLYKPVLRLIDTRRAETEKEIADAQATDSRAKAALADIERTRAGIADERTAALKAAAAEAEDAASTRRRQAEREAEAILTSARETVTLERKQALAEARRSALDLGVDVARRLLDEVPTELRAEAWLERVEQHLAKADPAERAAIADALKNGGSVRAVTAVALPEPVMADWRTRLRRALGDHVAVTFEADPALIAGVELHLPDAILHFSWRSVVASMRTEMEAHDDNR